MIPLALAFAAGLAAVQPPTTPPAPAATQTQGRPGESAPAVDPALHEIFETTQPTLVAEGFRFAEGPVWMGGRLLICDLGGNTMYDLGAGKHEARREWRKPSDRAAGACLDTKGRLIVAHFAGSVTRQDLDGTISTIASACDGVALSRCNDVVVRSDGRIFFTDFGGGKDTTSRGLFSIGPDSKVSQVDAGFEAANGLAFSPDERTLYVNDYGGGKTYGLDIDAGGAMTRKQVLHDFPGSKGARPDGMKVDAQGRIFTTGPGGVHVLSPDGTRLALLPLSVSASNLAFGEDNLRTLFVTAGNAVYAVRTREPGLGPVRAKPAPGSTPNPATSPAAPAPPAAAPK